jgi:hypothetical protein
MTPRREALAFRIWQFASAREWNVTSAEIAEALGESTDKVRAVAAARGWAQRMRSLTSADPGKSKGWQHGNEMAAHYIAADLVAGRISNDAGV